MWSPLGRFVVPGLVAAAVMVGLQVLLPEMSPLIEAPVVIGLGGLAYLLVARLQGAAEVSLVTAPLARALADPGSTAAVVCGPEVMIRVTAERLEHLGLLPEAIVVSLERNMQCGMGQCGRCQLGPRLLCRAGAVMAWPDAAPLLGVRGW